MATFNKFDSFVTELAAGTHAALVNSSVDTLKAALTNTPPVVGDTQLSDITQIAYTNIAGWPIDVENTTSQTAGTITVVAADKTATASGGSSNAFQYVVLYNDTASNDELVGWYDNGSAVTLTNGQTFTVNFGASLFTVA